MTRRLFIVDTDDAISTSPVRPPLQTGSLSEDFGRKLDTIAKATQWLTHPQNWHDSKMYILRWNGLLPTINKTNAMAMIDNPKDDGLAWCVVMGQRDMKNGKKNELEEPVAE